MASLEHPTLFDLTQLESIQARMAQRYPAAVVTHFWQQVTVHEACACHLWDDRCTGWAQALSHGYGRFTYNGTPQDAHRFFYDALYGPLSRQQYVLHTPPCLIRACIRHLYLGTAKENIVDAITMGRAFPAEEMYQYRRSENNYRHRHPETLQGEGNPRATLTEAIVLAIRADRREGMTLKELQIKYQRGPSCIKYIVARRTWKHLL